MNKVMLLGNLTRDPELQTTNSGKSVCRFGLAVQRRFANQDGERDADFFNITVWGVPGENAHKYLKKGSKCGVCGRIQIGTYDAADGSKRTSVDIIADEIEFVGPRNSGDGEGATYQPQESSSRPAPKPKQTAELQEIDDESLPF